MPANTNYGNIVATTIESRSKEVADNLTRSNALLAVMNKKGNVTPITGTSGKIVETFVWGANTNTGWYSGFGTFSLNDQDQISASEFTMRQLYTAIPISGLEMAQNSGPEQIQDQLMLKIEAAESTLKNTLAQSMYSDGTGFGGQELTGLNAALPINPAIGVYGNIDRAAFPFWRHSVYDVLTATARPRPVLEGVNELKTRTTRGADKADLFVCDNATWIGVTRELQDQTRIMAKDMADMGFSNIVYDGITFVLDGGIGGYCPAKTGFLINTKYLRLRPHKDYNMVSRKPVRAVNQDAEVIHQLWFGNLTSSGNQFHGRLVDTRP